MSVNQVNISSDNGLSPNRCQAIIKTNAGLLSIGPLGANVNGILIEVQNFIHENASENIISKMASILSTRRRIKVFNHIVIHLGLMAHKSISELCCHWFTSKSFMLHGHQAITWNTADLSSIVLQTKNESNLYQITKKFLKMSPAKWLTFCSVQ